MTADDLPTSHGIVLVTTNAGGRIDSAFPRRIDATIEFVPPDAQQWWELRIMQLPVDHAVSGELLSALAREYRCAAASLPMRGAVQSYALSES